MTQNGDRERELGRQARMVSIVIAMAMVLWLAAQWLGPALGLPGRYAFLFDMAALAAFVWALVVTYRIWRARRDNQG
ncbi:MAG: DUF5337 domain-containing protein [Tranquillimonas sp.]